MDAGDALRNWGARRCWQKPGQTVDGIGFTLDEWSWPRWDAAATTGWLRVWPNPDLISAPARWTGTGWGAKMPLDPLVIPWGPGWRGGGGSDNGVIIAGRNGETITAQGLAPLAWWHRLQISAATWWRANLTEWDWRADAISITRPGDQVRGSQGPWTKLDGLLVPELLASDAPWPGPLRLVAVNGQWGPGATAAPGAWVEHPGPARYGHMAAEVPSGADPRCIPCGSVIRLDITEQQISRWLDAAKATGRLRETKARFARGLRDTGMRLSETGSGEPIIESCGAVNPVDRKAWASLGVTNNIEATQLGAGLFTHGTLREAA